MFSAITIHRVNFQAFQIDVYYMIQPEQNELICGGNFNLYLQEPVTIVKPAIQIKRSLGVTTKLGITPKHRLVPYGESSLFGLRGGLRPPRAPGQKHLMGPHHKTTGICHNIIGN